MRLLPLHGHPIAASLLPAPRHAMHDLDRSHVRPAMAAADDDAGLYTLSKMLDGDRDSALDVAGTVEEISESGSDDELDLGFDAAVIVVGAGAAGIGMGIMLTDTFGLDASRVLILERGPSIGTSFRRWPEEMKFISPSFNQAGWTNSFDLNSIAYGSSPAYTLHAQHPSGAQYADYLDDLARMAKVRESVLPCTEVLRVDPVDGVFDVHVRSRDADGAPFEDTLRSKYVVWAAGEFQYPREDAACGVGGAELCVHNSRVPSWASLPGDDLVVIGGYESGVDAAVNLAKAGKRSTVLASTATWNVRNPDASFELAPYTAERLREVTAPGYPARPTLLAPLRVKRVERAAAGGFDVIAEWKAAEKSAVSVAGLPRVAIGGADTSPAAGDEGSELVVHTAQPPILCTGFEGSVASAARELFHFADESDEVKGCLCGAARLTGEDESTKVPGVFLAGPSVSQGGLSFCFVYKFRQRFGVVANAICRGLGRDTRSAVADCRQMNMYLDDFDCCAGSCGDAC